MATIRDIARISGFGIGTVSRVLNGSRQVRPETARTVLDAARRLQYIPGRREHGSWGNTTLGIALPSVIHPFWMEIVRGVYRALEETRYHLLLYNLGKQPSQVYLHILEEKPAALLVIGGSIPSSILSRMNQEELTFLYLDRMEEAAPGYYNDNRQGGRLAAEYLISRGVQQPVYIGEEYRSQQQEDRLSGFLEVLKEKDVCLSGEYYIRSEEAESRKLTLRLIKRGEGDGIFYFSDSLAYGGLTAMRESGEHLCFCGYDDQIPSKHLGITSIRQPGYRLGFEGALELVRAVRSGSIPGSRSFSPELIEREPRQ